LAADRPSTTSPERHGRAPFVRIEGVTRRFGAFTAVSDVSLDIHEGEFFSLLGGSGCGKSTLLRMLAGLDRPTSGRIWIDGMDMTDTPPYRRPVNMMFQSYALFPHLNVFNNVAFGLRQQRTPRAELRARVGEALELVELADFARRRPDQLSGGQRQRVALARALVKRPKLLLLDEPLAALDKKLRERTQLELAQIQHQIGITFVLVTHDQDEAMNLSTRIGVMRDGALEQVGPPREIYECPANRFVAEFVGSVNLLRCERLADPRQVRCAELDATLTLADPPGTATGTAGSGCWLAIRPEKIQIDRDPAVAGAAGRPLAGTIETITYLGAQSTYHVRLTAGALLQVTAAMGSRSESAELARGTAVWLSWMPDNQIALPE